ncbi:MAG: hypothetical protein U0451_03150 [Candidatus Saccharimonadales bacterium]
MNTSITDNLETMTEVAHWDIIGSDELGPEQRDQVYSFREALENCYEHNGVRVLDVRSRMHVVDVDDGKSTTMHLARDIESRLARSGHTLWVSPDYDWLKAAGYTKFNVVRSTRAETSAHKVFFGVLHDGDPEDSLPIAIKPCTTNPKTAYVDWLNGELATINKTRRYNPVGFMVINSVGYSLTELDNTSDTLDTSNWAGGVLNDDTNPEYKNQVTMLSDIGRRLAELHKKNIFHGDPQFKNIAIDVAGEIFFIDWESASFYSTLPKPTEAVHKISHDLRVMFSSMARSEADKGIGLLDGYKEIIQWELFKKHILNPYIETFLDGSDDISNIFNIIADVEVQLEGYIVNGELYRNLQRSRIR